MKLYSVNSGHFKLDGGAMFGVVPKSLWHQANPSDDNNMCSWAMRCLLVEHGNHLILIDNGMGNKQDEKFFGHYFLHGEDTLEKSLSRHGFRVEDITDVFLTHLHFDHCGGSIRRDEAGKLVPAFPNALYWTNHEHWAAATTPNDREKASFLKENILPMEEAGVLRFVETGEGEEWLPDFRVRFVKGHTDAMMLPQIRCQGKTLLYCADLIPSIHHLPMPWIMAYDMRPLDTLKEKKALLREAVANDWILFFEHDPLIACCSLQDTPKGIRALEQNELSFFFSQAG
ncbi:MAG: MBL fold metallo-hydrolase [Bacteroidetes bacterium]|nr:MBL fold metallo-hydrolase [Bacteroidota bacterium]